MIFDSDRYIDKKLASVSQTIVKNINLIKPPNNKVPATNLTKLAPERKIVQIDVTNFQLIFFLD